MESRIVTTLHEISPTHKGPNTTTDAAKDQPHHAKNLAPDTTLPPERKDTPRVDPTPLHHVKDRAVPEPHQVTCLDSPHPGGTQELCESRGSCPGHPVPTTPYGLCGREATLNSNHTLDWTSHEGLSTTTDTKPDATLPPRTSVQHVTWKSRTQRHACIHTPRAPDTSATRKTRETSETCVSGFGAGSCGRRKPVDSLTKPLPLPCRITEPLTGNRYHQRENTHTHTPSKQTAGVKAFAATAGDVAT